MSTFPDTRPRAIALFVGEPATSRINGADEPSAFTRRAADGPLELTESGIAGNLLATPRRLGAANHAVYLFHDDHRRHFENLLQRPIPRGAFGENVTYRGPMEDTLRIGDRLRIGSAEIALTLPRIPCYKLAHFLGTEAGFPSAFSASGRTGIYARVTTPGEIRPGSSISVVRSDPMNATIAELNEVLTGPHPSPDAIAHVLASPDLLPGLKTQIEDRTAMLGLRTGSETGTAIIERIDPETPDIAVVTFRYRPPDDASLPRPGQFVTIGIEDGEGRRHFRCYSLIEAPFDGGPHGPWRIAVKRERASVNAFSVSNRIHDGLRAGTACAIFPPAGDFTLPGATNDPILFIAGGIGITPVLAQLRALAHHACGQPARLVYVARHAGEMAFAGALRNVRRAMPYLQVRLFLTGISAPVTVGAIPATPGRPDLRAEIGSLPEGAHIHVCGPAAMVNEVRDIQTGLGRRNDLLRYELFAAAEETAIVDAAESATVRLQPDGIAATWRRGDGPLLEWIENHTGHRPPAACRSGLCRTCRARLRRGSVAYPAGISPPSSAEVLLCCARPAGDIEIELNVEEIVQPQGVT
ncbi:MAG: MOSC domain-containing protein [Rhodospirillales bacterium]